MRRRLVAALTVIPAVLSLIALLRPASAEPAAPYNWTGFYLGGNVGWMWSKADTTVAVPGAAPASPAAWSQ